MQPDLEQFIKAITEDIKLLEENKLATQEYIEFSKNIDLWLKKEKNENNCNH